MKRQRQTLKWSTFVSYVKQLGGAIGCVRISLPDHIDQYSSLSLEQPIWGVTATLRIQLNPISDDDKEVMFDLEPIGISWSSTERDIANALVAIEHYQTAVLLAAKIQSYVGSKAIIS